MKQHKIYLMAGLLGLMVTTLLVSSLASADENNTQFGCDPKKQTAMMEIIDNNDYNAWSALMTDQANQMISRGNDLLGKINEENFAKVVQMHQLMADGNFEEAKAIGDELGLPISRGFGDRGSHHMFPLQPTTTK
ncbi:MAG: hypothetical protein COV55_03015 [Candidatus Komeilibacteria bacterium CG11_big_fil_rev_8_21_14_0_20_36_20]|uniref:DUF4142 domain-containing protein n=1 Tax=Candidatus Komeilibacteria bacterium CG11_big_fil_rev_8_21_14_0_20_36_20 TaxID=1974477 RepID=A0A2H0NC82_9BACT|nr:MAG: hypothetical protein COV55_03015 [Candidatus Komeilibacteria bacterium CG11_big_fil_rev_8_21_14_0_20_36_20]PJC55567.1 MAG: hypothetical protein CO027_01380 [Candidatus Komeilibacteria bacterium CG_4_9_14_0_2_um_filter_36_13]